MTRPTDDEPRSLASKPRRPHHSFKWLIGRGAHRAVAFAARQASADRQARMVERWNEANIACCDDNSAGGQSLLIGHRLADRVMSSTTILDASLRVWPESALHVFGVPDRINVQPPE